MVAKRELVASVAIVEKKQKIVFYSSENGCKVVDRIEIGSVV